MLKKQYVKSRNVCRVTFELLQEEWLEGVVPEKVCVIGDFNDWSDDGTPMKCIKSTGSYKVAIDLEPERSYQFRYLINGQHWCNDGAASAYVSNEHGSENSVVETTLS